MTEYAWVDHNGVIRLKGTPNPAISGGGTVNSVTAADTSIVVGGTAADPTIATATLDVIATDHAPAADWSNNSKKITNLANGASAQDAAAFGQIPTALPPNGSAGGDLTGTYPNPTIGAGKVTTTALASAVTLDAIATAHATAADVAMNSHKITGLTNGSSSTDAAAFGQVLRLYSAIPQGAIAENFPRVLNNAAFAGLLSQRLSLVAILLPNGATVTSITFVSSNTGVTGGNHQLFALYDDDAGGSTGTARQLLRGTADDTSTAWNANTRKTLNLTSTYTTTRSGVFYVGILIDASVVPTLAGTSGPASAGIGDTTFTPVPIGASTTGQTSLPDPADAVSTVNNSTPYCFVS